MIQRLEICGFKCFKRIRVEGLSRVNFIVGDNGTGKTALLEAIFMASGNSPNTFFITRYMRGLTGLSLIPVRGPYESMFKAIFHRMNSDSGATVQFFDDERGERALWIGFRKDFQRELILPEKNGYESSKPSPLVFRWNTHGGERESEVEVKDGQISVGVTTDYYPGILLGVTPESQQELAERFSALSRRNSLDTVVCAVKSLFPDVKSLSLELDAGQNSLFAEVRNLGERLPIGSLSAGFSRLVSILLSIASVPNGIVLIDEIENGFYFQKQLPILNSIAELCERNGTQLFATTHSMEFLSAVQPSVDAAPDVYSLLRTSKVNGASEVERFAGKDLAAALHEGVDVR